MLVNKHRASQLNPRRPAYSGTKKTLNLPTEETVLLLCTCSGSFAFAAAALMAAALQSPATAHVIEIRRGDSGTHVALLYRDAEPDSGEAQASIRPTRSRMASWSLDGCSHSVFERTSGIPSDGKFRARDRRTWLGAFITRCGALTPTIYPGSYGPLVGHAQLELNEWLRTQRPDRHRLTIDLLYGPETQEVAQLYQAEHGLPKDGIVGRRT